MILLYLLEILLQNLYQIHLLLKEGMIIRLSLCLFLYIHYLIDVSISIMRSIPNMTVLVPADGVEARKMIFEISNYTGPVYVRLGRLSVGLF